MDHDREANRTDWIAPETGLAHSPQLPVVVGRIRSRQVTNELNPRKRNGPKGTSPIDRARAENKHATLAERYKAFEDAKGEKLRLEVIKEFSPEWIVSFPLLNPLSIIEKAESSSMHAASLCQQTCYMLSKGHHRRVQEYLAVAYAIAMKMKDDDRACSHLASEVRDGRFKDGVPPKVVREKILHYLFIFIFYQSGLVTRDRASQYAQSLDEFFYEGKNFQEVADILKRHGQDRLRRAGQRQRKLEEGARALLKQGRNPAVMSMIELLEIIEREEKKADVSIDEDLQDLEPRELPPQIDDAENEGDFESDAESDEVSPPENDDDAPQDTELPKNTDAANDENEPSIDDNEAADIDEQGIDGAIISGKLSAIVASLLQMGANLTDQPIDRELKKDTILTTVVLANELIELQLMIAGIGR